MERASRVSMVSGWRGLVAILLVLALVAVDLGLSLDFRQDRHCGTMEVFLKRRNLTLNSPLAAKCPLEGTCDDPTVRDACKYCGDLTIPVIVHVIQQANGKNPGGITLTTISDSIDQLNQDYQSYGFKFNLADVMFHPFPSSMSGYNCLSAYGENGDSWFYEILEIKNAYAVTPSEAINIFVTCQTQSDYGTLLGIGTFPWDETATTAYGGLWMNAVAMGRGYKTLTHEMGHNLGLWHTFHGVSEVESCADPCYEEPHLITNSAANHVGDFCSDTPAAPRHYDCKNPSGSSPCDGASWGTTDVSNFMSYTPDSCMSQFTDQQELRMHCWACTALPGITSGC